jgi:uncharacterized protein YcbX
MESMNNNARASTTVATVAALWRYPVKSMGPEALPRADVSWFGLAGDRRWAFVRNDVPQSGFPWFTIRERDEMSRYMPAFVDPSRPDRSRTMVRTPSGKDFEVTDSRLAAELCPDGIRLIRQDRGVFDTFPVSLISTQTIARIGKEVGAELHAQRFRPNILVEALPGEEFPEDQWVGRVLRIGGLRMRVDKRDGRCVVITIDPATRERNAEVLRYVAGERQGCAGVYGTTVEPGTVSVGDAVVME